MEIRHPMESARWEGGRPLPAVLDRVRAGTARRASGGKRLFHSLDFAQVDGLGGEGDCLNREFLVAHLNFLLSPRVPVPEIARNRETDSRAAPPTRSFR